MVTYEAADRGAVCCLGCHAWLLILGGIGLVVWYLFGEGVWAAITGAILVVGGLALSRFLVRGRSRWEVSFDRQRRVVTITSCVSRGTLVREIPFAQIVSIELREITRNVSTGSDVPYQLPVFRLTSGEEVALDERLSVKDSERAGEVLEEMRRLLLDPCGGPQQEEGNSTSKR
ncbi:MAG TPA: hypothetical protein DEP45_00470 [Armatimonadetes bacterium]|mgnify:FL=1|nr:hypothetical protein [Armatimonadota bacterium]